jgi:hypothetical protein
MSKKKTGTTFAGKVNPWTGARGNVVDVDALSITSDPVPVLRVRGVGKYDALFSKMRLGQSVKCQPENAPTIAQALTKWAARHHDGARVRYTKRYADGAGRVWLLPPADA